jgi:heme-degrading monooxygenase HmoA
VFDRTLIDDRRMLLILFRSRLRADAGADYQDMATEMLASASAMPGFVEYKHYTADDGERLTIVKWQDEATLTAWREHARHRVAQRLGRERWYAEYQIEVAEVVRDRKWQLDRSLRQSID